MPEIGARIWKCYYAGKAGNQPLARFQLKEAVNLMEMGAFVRPKYEENMTKFLAEDVEQGKQAIAVVAKPDHPSTHENPNALSRDHSPGPSAPSASPSTVNTITYSHPSV